MNDIAWREEIKLLELQRAPREQVTGVADAVFTRQYYTQFLGNDRREDGTVCPVVYRRLTHLRTWELMQQGATIERLIQHELWLHEQVRAWGKTGAALRTWLAGWVGGLLHSRV